MISRRRLTQLLGLAALLGADAARADEPPPPSVLAIRGFYATLLETMKDGAHLGFNGRRTKLAPTIQKSFDLPLMTRLMVGPQWQNLAPDDQKQIVDAFSAFCIATYANRFDDYSGEHFEVDDQPAPVGNGDLIVHTKLVKGENDNDPVELDYLMRADGGSWQIIDVYLSGTVSELATRRSEFTSVMRRGGAAALVDLLQRRVAELSG
jgi:phospholipid transport system substrate-binding protein